MSGFHKLGHIIYELYIHNCMLYSSHSVKLKSKQLFAYSSYGVNCAEVELDVLTGEIQILRSDILFDCGQRYIY